MKEKQIRERLEEEIRQAQLVLVGIGLEFSCSDKQEEQPEREKKQTWPYRQEQIVSAYQKLAALLQGKNYFIVTLCMDDLIYEAPFQAERIVAPCGGKRYLQCSAGCCEELRAVEKLSEEQLRDLEAGEFPVCERCGASLCYNSIEAASYVEAGYLPQWEKYRKWLTGTVNQNLCVLELGAGLEFPSIIRWPFEKVVYLNEKSHFYRVHSHLYQLTEEIKNRAASVAQDPVTFLFDKDTLLK